MQKGATEQVAEASAGIRLTTKGGQPRTALKKKKVQSVGAKRWGGLNPLMQSWRR